MSKQEAMYHGIYEISPFRWEIIFMGRGPFIWEFALLAHSLLTETLPQMVNERLPNVK